MSEFDGPLSRFIQWNIENCLPIVLRVHATLANLFGRYFYVPIEKMGDETDYETDYESDDETIPQQLRTSTIPWPPPPFDSSATHDCGVLLCIQQHLQNCGYERYDTITNATADGRTMADIEQTELLIATGTGQMKAIASVSGTRHQYIGPLPANPPYLISGPMDRWVSVGVLPESGTGGDAVPSSLERNQLRIGLYESLRQSDVFTQPSGVDWAIAQPYDKSKRLSHRRHIGHTKTTLHAVNITEGMLFEITGQPVPKLPIDGQMLALDDPAVLVLENPASESDPAKWAVWLLSNLDYPLMMTHERFAVHEIGQPTAQHQIFQRTESLVDIGAGVKYVVLVMNDSNKFDKRPTDNLMHFVPLHKKWPAAGGTLQSVDIMSTVLNFAIYLIDAYPWDLRELFDLYIVKYLVRTRLMAATQPWQEIMDKCALLTWRWHRQPEARMSAANGRQLLNCPRTVVDAYNVDQTPATQFEKSADERENKGLSPLVQQCRYNGDSAVSAADTAFVLFHQAQANPLFRTGRWSTRAQLSLMRNELRHYCRRIERAEEEAGECNMALLGRRNQLWRRSTEDWKRLRGWRDELAAPGTEAPEFRVLVAAMGGATAEGSLGLLWRRLMHGTSVSWAMNGCVSESCRSETGIRTGLHLWRNGYIDGAYVRETSVEQLDYELHPDSTLSDEVFVRGPGALAMRQLAALNDALMRVNWATLEDERLGYYDAHADGGGLAELRPLVCRLSSTANHALWKRAGWLMQYAEDAYGDDDILVANDFAIGWGVNAELPQRERENRKMSLVLTHWPRMIVDHMLFRKHAWTVMQL